MASCADCGEITLIDNPLQCINQPRLKTLSKIGFYPCNTTLPSPLTEEGLEALIADKTIVFSNPLANITPGDPTYQEIAVTDCAPAQRIVVGREITFQDRIGVSFPNGSPIVPINYWDYRFWQDKMEKQLSLNYLIQYCDGDVVIPLGQNGQPLSADMSVFLNWERASTQGGPSVEFKSGSIRFGGDPMALTNPPAFNIAADGTVTVYSYEL